MNKNHDINPTTMKEVGNYYALLNQVPIELIVKTYCSDGNGEFTGGEVRFASKLEATRHNLSINEMVGKTDFDLMPENCAEAERAEDIMVMQGKMPIKRIKLINCEDCSSAVAITKTPLFDGAGDVVGVMRIVLRF